MWMNEQAQELIDRTAAFATNVSDFCETIPDTRVSRKIIDQLLDAANSVAMNYRATCRAGSRAEFIAKVGLVREEADESYGWLKQLVSTKSCTQEAAAALIQEANELTAIMNSSFITSKTGRKKRPNNRGWNRQSANQKSAKTTPRRSQNHQSRNRQSPNQQSPNDSKIAE